MTIVYLSLGALAVAGVVGRLARVVRTDGYGLRPPPRSHRDWWEGVDPTGRGPFAD